LIILIIIIVPGVLVTWYSGKIIFRLFDEYQRSLVSGQTTPTPEFFNNNLQKFEITKRLISVLFLFILKNTAYIVITIKASNKDCPKYDFDV
jgi:hypothetical protein